MRPRKLVMTAFGPYADTETIDFTELGSCNFFLIHGPTGSGKTTILDAMCFALYGVTSGDERDGRQMRSQYAAPGQLTKVVFDFELGGNLYRVERSPWQEIAKKRGTGTTTVNPNATLWQCWENGETAVLTAGWSNVTEAMERLLKFKSNQFRQVVMLPQGEFRKLLTANSRDRESIMETLFQTEVFHRLEKFLDTASRNMAKEVRELNLKYTGLLEEAGVQDLAELEASLAANRQELNDYKAKSHAARQRLQLLQAELVKAQRDQSILEEKEQAARALSQLEAQSSLFEAKRRDCKLAKQAQLIVSQERLMVERRAEMEQAAVALAGHEAKLQQAALDWQKAAAALATEQEREAERIQVQQEIGQLEALSAKVLSLAEAYAALDKARHRHAAAQQALQDRQRQLETVTASIEQLTREYEAAKIAAVMLPAWEAAVRETAEICRKAEELEQLRQQYGKFQQQLAKVKADYDRLMAALQAAQQEFLQLQEEWYQGQAALLAAGLQAGRPCPVCGSTSHPDPACSDSPVPSPETLKEKQRALQKLEQERDKSYKLLTDLTAQQKSLAMRGQELKKDLGGKASLPLAELKAEHDRAKEKLNVAKAASLRAEELADKLASQQTLLQAVTSALNDCQTEVQAAAVALEATLTVVTERERDIPDGLRQPDSLAAALEAAKTRRDGLIADLERAQAAAQETMRVYEHCRAAVEAAKQNLEQARSHYQTAAVAFEQQLRQVGFSGSDDYLEAKGLIDKLPTLEQEIQAYDAACFSAQERYRRAEELAQGIQMPDTAGLAAQAEQAQADYDAVVKAMNTMELTIKRQEDWLKRSKQLAAELKAAEERYAVVGRLAEVANGQNSLRLSFQRFVLTTLLDDVIVAANARLKIMSRGRYSLVRRVNPIHRGSAGGLDLEVEDAYTGYARSVTTLSGGETFLASLALALGLADVVQNYSGGIYLDTIFVDEGFGTLDPEALDLAMQALLDLQSNGRLVGIISHVPELKERIDVRLEVIPVEKGSTTRFRFSRS